jgi:hypothetical protein
MSPDALVTSRRVVLWGLRRPRQGESSSSLVETSYTVHTVQVKVHGTNSACYVLVLFGPRNNAVVFSYTV